MRSLLKRIVSMALAIAMAVSYAAPVYAESTEDSFAFEMAFKVAKEEKMIRLYKDGDELYIAHDAVPLLGEIEDHGSYFERSDGAAIILEDDNTVRFDGVQYHPFEDIMIGLCLNTMFFEEGSGANVERDTVSLVPANNIFKVVELGNKAMDYEALNLYGYTPEAFSEVEEPKTNIFTSIKNSIKNNLFSGITQEIENFEDYNCYRTAIWDVMLPVNADLLWTSEYNDEAIEAMNTEAYISGAEEDAMSLFMDGEAFLSEGIERAGTGLDITSLDDYLGIIEFVYNIDNIDQSIGNAFSIMQKLHVTQNENLKKAIDDTVDLYNNEITPVDLYIDHVGMGALDATTDALTSIAELPKALSLVADGYDLYEQETYDKSLKNSYDLAFGNLGIQEAAGDVFRQQMAGMRRLTSYEDRAVRAKDMCDVLMVYLLAAHNVWQAVGDLDEFKDDKKQVIYDIEKKYLAELQKLSYVDFEVYKTAAATKSMLLEAAVPLPESTPQPTETPAPTTEPVQAKDNQFVVSTIYNDYVITYDTALFKLEKSKYGTGMSVGFADDVGAQIDKYYTTSVQVGDQYMNFDDYYGQIKSLYPLEHIEGNEVRGVKYGKPVSVSVGGGYTVKYFDIECISTKDPNAKPYTLRYFYLDMGNGEGFAWNSSNYENHLGTIGVSTEEFCKKLFVNIEVNPRADAPAKWDSGLLETTFEGEHYKITYNPDVVWVDKSEHSDNVLFVRNSGGVTGVNDQYVRNGISISNKYGSAAEVLDYYSNLYYNRYKFVENPVVGEYMEMPLGNYTAKYFLAAYYDKNLEKQIDDVCCFAIELENGKVIEGTILFTAEYKDQVGITYKDVLENTFQNIEIAK